MKKRLWLSAAAIAAALPLIGLIVLATGGRGSPAPAKAASAPAPAPPASMPQVRTVVPPPGEPAPVVPVVSRDQFALPAAHVWGREATIGEFTIRAVNRYWAGPAAELLTLDHAIESGACVIRESGRLQELSAEVTGSRAVLALVGDMLIGGRQDRLVARTCVLEPGQNTIEVFTAELQRRPDAAQQLGLTHDFTAPQVDLNVKAAVLLDGSQPGVSLAIAQVAGAYGSYRETIVDRGAAVDAVVARARRIVWAFTVGFVVYKGDRLVAADLFESTLLLERVADKLLRSYAMTAVYGDLSNWTADPAAATPAATNTPGQDPGPANLDRPQARHIVTDDELVRRECRRTPGDKPVHTAIFRK